MQKKSATETRKKTRLSDISCRALPIFFSPQWMSLELPPNNETGKIFVCSTSLFWCASLSELLQSAGYKNPGYQWRTLSVSVVSTTTATPQLSQLRPPHPIPLCLSWRKEFLTFWYRCFCCHGPWKRAWRQCALLSSGVALTFNFVRLLTCHMRGSPGRASFGCWEH